MLIVTSTTRSATPGDISVYDAHVRSAVADGGHVDIRDYSQLFKALAGTKDGTTPKGHTGTNPNSDGTGEQIWWLNGPRAANNYADFYDDDGWDHANPARTEAGAAKTLEAYDSPLTVDSDNGVWTGATAGGDRSANEHLGTGRNQARVGIPFSRTTVWSIGGHALKDTQLGLYGLSDVLLVEAPDSPYATVAAITTDPANGSDYRAGETIKATATFSEAVTVTGTPQLPLRIGDNMRDADYVAGDSSDTVLSFSYPVTADDLDEDGISIDAFVLKLNGGSIKRKDTTVDAALTHTRVAAAGGQRVSRPARAQTTLVSNTGQSQFATDAASYDRTQGFTTGQNPGGYNLDTVEIVSVDPQGNDATVSVCTVISAHLPAHYPTSTCTALTPPDSFAAGTLLFTAPAGTILTPSTPYVVVIGSPGGEKLEMSMTDSDDEDDHGEDDWTIAGVYHFELVEGLWINFLRRLTAYRSHGLRRHWRPVRAVLLRQHADAQHRREHGGEPERRCGHPRGDGRRRRQPDLHDGGRGRGLVQVRGVDPPDPDQRGARLRGEVVLLGDRHGVGRHGDRHHRRDDHRHRRG